MSRISELLEKTTNEDSSQIVKKALSTKIVGNAMSDRKLMDMLHDIIMNSDGLFFDNDRIAAIKKLDQVMGVEQSNYSMKDVEDYVEENK